MIDPHSYREGYRDGHNNARRAMRFPEAVAWWLGGSLLGIGLSLVFWGCPS